MQNQSHFGLPAMIWMQIYMEFTELEYKGHLYSTLLMQNAEMHLFIFFPKLRTSGKFCIVIIPSELHSFLHQEPDGI